MYELLESNEWKGETNKWIKKLRPDKNKNEHKENDMSNFVFHLCYLVNSDDISIYDQIPLSE
jgi:hypothetical protein